MYLQKNFLETTVPGAELLQGSLPCNVAFAIDSRSLCTQDLFFALQGNNVDGHIFLKDAFSKCAGVVIATSKKHLLDELPESLIHKKIIILVPDPYTALITLAAVWRSQFSYPIAAITGSVGKTSTKEITAHILAQENKKYVVSEGNLNTLLGVAITISRMTDAHDGALFEIGISKKGEMGTIVDLLRPTLGLITCIAPSHIEGLGNIANIAHEKRTIFKNFFNDSIGIVNGDQPLLGAISYHHPIIKFGYKLSNQIQARKITPCKDGSVSFFLKIYNEKFPITLTQNHKGIILNILAATTLATQLNIPAAHIAKHLKTLPTRKQRFQLCTLKNNRGILIDDCYNASPESVKAALLALETMHTKGKKIAVLADMLELGSLAPFWHRQIGRFLRKIPSLNQLILIGNQVAWIKKTAPHTLAIEHVASWKDAIPALSDKLDNDSLILIKGSHGMQLHNIVQNFIEPNS